MKTKLPVPLTYNQPMRTPQENVSAEELRKFESSAHDWWNPQGDFRTLHDLTPLRADYIKSRAKIDKKHVLDVGCGGGLLCETLARRGAHLTGIDLAESALEIARAHMRGTKLHIDYRLSSAETLAGTEAGSYDVVICFELLEHVPDPASTIAACAQLTKPGGNLFFSTINRNLKSYLFAVVGAEYVLRLLPRGTHDYRRLIRPSELIWAAKMSSLIPCDLSGVSYHPFSRRCKLSRDTRVNYITHFRTPA